MTITMELHEYATLKEVYDSVKNNTSFILCGSFCVSKTDDVNKALVEALQYKDEQIKFMQESWTPKESNEPIKKTWFKQLFS